MDFTRKNKNIRYKEQYNIKLTKIAYNKAIALKKYEQNNRRDEVVKLNNLIEDLIT